MNYILKFIGSGETTTQSYTDDYFLDYIKNSNLLKDSTKKIYLTKLDIIMNKFFDKPQHIWWVLQHPDLFEVALDKFVGTVTSRIYEKPSPHVYAIYVRVLLTIFKHHREIQEQHKDLYKVWKQLNLKISQPIDDKYLEKTKSERQKEADMPFDKLVDVRNSLRDGSIEKLVFSLYTMIPPVRSDFQLVKIYQKKPSKNLNENYIVLGSVNILVLNNYKTSETYGQIEIPLPDELVKQIKMSLSETPREYLFVNRFGVPYEKQNSFSSWINGLVRRVLDNKAFTLTMFRHIYLARPDLDIESMPLYERKAIAKEMGHSVRRQDDYILK